jgi:hypothetical protein
VWTDRQTYNALGQCAAGMLGFVVADLLADKPNAISTIVPPAPWAIWIISLALCVIGSVRLLILRNRYRRDVTRR